MLLAACSSSNDGVEPQVQEPQGQGTEEPESDFTLMSYSRTHRALTTEEEFSSVGVFLTGTGEPQTGQFHYRQNDHRWHSSLEVTSGQGYRLYGYAPADAVTAAISAESAAGVTMTFTSLPTISSQDICFVVGVQHMAEPTEEKDIKLGKFSFTGGSQDHNFLRLLMDHLYAGLRLQMTIDADYAQLRSIKIRRLELQTSNATAQAVVVLTANTENTDPVGTVTYSGLAGTERTVAFFESTEGVTLNASTTTTPVVLDAMCCFVPSLSDDLTLVTTYDVYNKNGEKIGERSATNKLKNLNAVRGERVTLTMNIKPTYLYVLSDPDLDNPTVVVN